MLFYCCNCSVNGHFYVNGIPINFNEKCRLNNHSLIEIADIQLLFDINIIYDTLKNAKAIESDVDNAIQIKCPK
ncbi:hypothetical protein GJ496_004544 [Pomphorhynchus laevis]|nr:hypothetical protein GJ496_004544 [Pomphorhynchus laevis]